MIIGNCTPAVICIPTHILIIRLWYPCKNKMIHNMSNAHTKPITIFLYLYFSASSSLLLSWSIGLNMIKLTDAITVTSNNFQSHFICMENLIHKNRSKMEPIAQWENVFAWYPPLYFRRIIKGTTSAIPLFMLPRIKPIPTANNNGNINKPTLYNAYPYSSFLSH